MNNEKEISFLDIHLVSKKIVSVMSYNTTEANTEDDANDVICNNKENFNATSILSKKRFYEIEDLVKRTMNDENMTKNFMQQFSTIMMFDPDKKSYTQKKGEYIKRHREKKSKKNITLLSN